MRTLAFAFAFAFALASVGCTGSPIVAPPTGPLAVHIVHLYNANLTPDRFGVPANDTFAHVYVKLENYYRGHCPAPVSEITVKDPDGQTYAHLVSQNLPLKDCEYTFERNETLKPGWWTIEYAGSTQGGPPTMGSIVDIKPVNTTASSP